MMFIIKRKQIEWKTFHYRIEKTSLVPSICTWVESIVPIVYFAMIVVPRPVAVVSVSALVISATVIESATSSPSAATTLEIPILPGFYNRRGTNRFCTVFLKVIIVLGETVFELFLTLAQE